ncbi:MAG: 5'-methylthioadenosine/S-adenosylhomocysteine nucleosidase [Alphaproteobacteria bacterium]
MRGDNDNVHIYTGTGTGTGTDAGTGVNRRGAVGRRGILRGVLFGGVGVLSALPVLSRMSQRSLGAEAGTSAVLTALDIEREAVSSALGGFTERHRVGPYDVFEHLRGARRFFVSAGGIGKVNTAALGSSLAERFDLDSFFMVGVCGALDESLDVHSTVISSELYQVDYGRREGGELVRFRAGAFPFGEENLESWEVPESWREVALSLAGEMGDVRVGAVGSGDHFVVDAAYGRLLNRRYGVYTIDMESAALAQVAALRGLPMLAVRTATDNARGDGAVLDFEENLAFASARAAEVFVVLVLELPFGV